MSKKLLIEIVWTGQHTIVGMTETSYHVRLKSNHQLVRKFSQYEPLHHCRYREQVTGFPHSIMCNMAHNLSDAKLDAIHFAILTDHVIDTVAKPQYKG